MFEEMWDDVLAGFGLKPAPQVLPPLRPRGPSLAPVLREAELRRVAWPLNRNRIRKGLVNNTFGWVRTDEYGKPKAHQGWDLEAPVGTVCYAVGYGTVVAVNATDNYNPSVSKKNGAYGKWVITSFIGSLGGVFTDLLAMYAHLDQIDPKIKVGVRVTPDTVVGRTGNSGNARGFALPDQHLHFEIRNGCPLNGLQGREDPKDVYGNPPLNAPEWRTKGITPR
jgi:murein DD-endopeptidase MepM/ murein hydrolase activator NlpD